MPGRIARKVRSTANPPKPRQQGSAKQQLPPKKPPQTATSIRSSTSLHVDPVHKKSGPPWHYRFEVRFIRWGTRSRLAFTDWTLLGFRGAQSQDPADLEFVRFPRWRRRVMGGSSV